MYAQVFDYNGLGRLTGDWATIAGPPSPIIVAAVESGQLLNAQTRGITPSWHRLLSGPFAADGGWLLPAASSARWACSSPGAAGTGATRCARPSCCGAAGG